MGFLGSHLVEALVDSHEITVMDDLSNRHSENLSGSMGELDLIQGTILDRALLEEACRGAACVIHLAAISSVAAGESYPSAVDEVRRWLTEIGSG